MTVAVHGIGWVDEGGYGCVRSKTRGTRPVCADVLALWKDPAVFPAPARNFGRFSRAAHLTCAAAALAMQDAGLPFLPEKKQDVGLLGANGRGSLQANLDYFGDYVNCGRTLARGNLFIYTLPTSALAEAAIYLGLQGPVFHASATQQPQAELLRTAGGIVGRGEAAAMLAVYADERAAVCFVLAPEGFCGHDALCLLEQAVGIAGNAAAPRELAAEFAAVM